MDYQENTIVHYRLFGVMYDSLTCCNSMPSTTTIEEKNKMRGPLIPAGNKLLLSPLLLFFYIDRKGLEIPRSSTLMADVK